MNQQTQQFMYRAVILTVCIILGGAFAFMFAAAIRLGDGEAVKIIDAMQTPVLGAFASLIAFVWGHQATQAAIAKFTGASNGPLQMPTPAPALPSSPASDAAPATPAPEAIPASGV